MSATYDVSPTMLGNWKFSQRQDAVIIAKTAQTIILKLLQTDWLFPDPEYHQLNK